MNIAAIRRFRQYFAAARFCQHGRLWSLVVAIAALPGCATCRNHPTACSVAGAIAAGSVAATIVANEHRHRDRMRRPDYGLHTRCGSPPHGDVYQPPSAGEGCE